MNYRMIAYLTGVIILIEAAFMLLPLLVALTVRLIPGEVLALSHSRAQDLWEKGLPGDGIIPFLSCWSGFLSFGRSSGLLSDMAHPRRRGSPDHHRISGKICVPGGSKRPPSAAWRSPYAADEHGNHAVPEFHRHVLLPVCPGAGQCGTVHGFRLHTRGGHLRPISITIAAG